MSKLKRLNHKDLQTLLFVLTDLYSEVGHSTLRERTLAVVTNVISAEITSFDCFNSDGIYDGRSWGNTDLNLTLEQIGVFNAFARENPIFTESVLNQRADPVKLSDFLSFRQFRNTTVYNEFYRLCGAADSQMAIALPVSSDFSMTCQMTRNGKDFSERDRLMMTLIAPHLINAVRNAVAFERLNSALETKDSGVIAIDRAGKMQFVSEFARRLLEKYFKNEKREDNSLPQGLWDWIKHHGLPATEFAPPSSPFKITKAGGELTIRLIHNRRTLEQTLLLEEKRPLTPKMLESLNLTRRESQVLSWMAQGKSDRDIAILCDISPYTVHKHAQNIFIKLGVETRTAAMLKALEV